MLASAEFWVMIAFFGFLALLVYYKVPGMLATALDKRAADISKALDEARRLREEAQALLASYEKKLAEAMKEAEAIVIQAKAEAERLAEETHKNMQAQVERRQQLAEDKIHQAEAQAVQEVRAAAADIAVTAARQIIADKVDASKDAKIVENSISELASKLH
ncbi:MAG TPA: ATP F0F1 synthase subunit B [Parvibaculum sp.]